MAYGEIILYRNWDTSNPLIFRASTNDQGIVCRPINRDDRIGDRTSTRRHKLNGGRTVRDFQIEAWATNNDWILLHEYAKQGGDRFSAPVPLDGHLVFEDWINYVPASFAALNGRSILPATTINTGRGVNKVLCAYKTVVKLAEDFESFIVPESVYQLTFTVEEL